MLKYIAYCRKSTDEKEKQILSIESQVDELKLFAEREQLNIVKFITESKTAKIPGRKQFENLLQLIEADEANGILSWHPDRLARNSIDGGKIIYLLDIGKLLDLKFPSFWFENTPQGKFMLNIAFSQSKYYIDNLSENVKRGNRQKLRRGEYPSKAPLGYLNNSKTRKIDIDPKTSKIVKKAFQLFSKGNKSFTEISRYLYKFGIFAKHKKPIKIDQVKNILTNKFYIGIMKYAGEYYKGSHKCFISKKLFNKVQSRIKKISKPRKHGHNFAFTGLARCGECGAAITAESHTKFYPSTRGKVEYVYYRCTKKIKPCTQGYIPEPGLEKQIRKIVSKAGLHPAWKPYLEKWIEKDKKKDELNMKKTLKNLKLKVNKVDLKLNRLLDAYLDQVIDSKVYKKKKNQLFEQKLKLEEQILKIRRIGSAWLEPLQKFTKLALCARKIARKKNNSHLLKQMAQKIGSNYSLKNRDLSARLFYPYWALAAGGGAASAPSDFASISKMVDPGGFEPPTSCMPCKRASQLRHEPFLVSFFAREAL